MKSHTHKFVAHQQNCFPAGSSKESQIGLINYRSVAWTWLFVRHYIGAVTLEAMRWGILEWLNFEANHPYAAPYTEGQGVLSGYQNRGKPSYCSCSVSVSSWRGRKAVKTSHVLQIIIFSFQSFWTTPSQIVPFINQQIFPALNSQAGHFFFRSGVHFFITQHGLTVSFLPVATAVRKMNCLSICPGILRHPCS